MSLRYRDGEKAALAAIFEAAERQSRYLNLVTEIACEASIQQGRCGVMVDRNQQPPAWVDERVPYGIIRDITACGVDGVRL